MCNINWTIKLLTALLTIGWCLPVQAQKYYIEVHEDLDQRDLQNKPIILINPRVDYYRKTNENLIRNYTKGESYMDHFYKYLDRSARKNDFDFQIKKPQDIQASEVAYFNQMGQFKEHLLNVNALQEHPLNREEGTSSMDDRVKNVMVKPPQVHPRFSQMTEAYNTPYFAVASYKVYKQEDHSLSFDWMESMRPDTKSLFYFILADVRSGDIIYREVKAFRGEPGKLEMFNQLYDTFYNLKESS